MTRYIDADKLKEDILEENSWYLYNEFGSTTQFHELIDKQPTVDALEVVRCKDCKHRNHCHETVAHTKEHDGFREHWSESIEWCSRGERKGGDDE